MKKSNGAIEGVLWIIILIPIIYFAAVYSNLPQQIATHFDVSGTPDDYSPKSSLWILVGGIQLLLWLILKYTPNFDPKGNLKKFDNSYSKLRIIIQLFIAIVCMILIMNANGVIENTGYAITFALAFLIMTFGNYLQTVKPNYFVGFRTPWTLESEVVWKKTHRLVGRIWFFSGLALLLLLMIVPQEYAIMLIIVVTLAGTLYGTIYSYTTFRKLKK